MKNPQEGEERLNRFLARARVASRREADRLILEGRVTVNGAVVREPGARIRPETDAVKVSGKRVGRVPPRVYVILNKPKGVVSTMNDPQGRPCVGDLLRGIPGRPVPAGRLDFDAEGLLLCTNDGEMVNRLLHPRYHVRKVYHVKVKGVPEPSVLERIASGVVLDGRRTLPAQAFFHKRGKSNMWLRIVLYEGRKHQVKRMLEACGVKVLKLTRVAMGPLRLGDLPVGSWRRLRPDELAALRAYLADLDKHKGALHNCLQIRTRRGVEQPGSSSGS
jgi:23S rRNA pseudouridine2605 synthase